jgi:hypothetical protein
MKLIFALFFLAAFIYFGLFALKQAGLFCRLPALQTVPALMEWGECPLESAPLRDTEYEAFY